MSATPTRTGLNCPSCQQPVGVVEIRLPDLTAMWCPACNHRWSAAGRPRSTPPPRVKEDRERRKHVRRPVFLDCRIEGTMVEGAMALTDLSESGCFIATTEEVPVGVEVRLQVMMAGSEVPLIGRVVRVQPRRGFAVEIDLAALSEQSRQALEQFLASAN